MRKAKAQVPARSEWWISKRLLLTAALSFAGAIAASHFLLKARSAGDTEALGRWASLGLALYFLGMGCISIPLVRRMQAEYAKKLARKRALEKEIELKRKFERKKRAPQK